MENLEDIRGGATGEVDGLCGKYQREARDNDNGLQCEKCDKWLHVGCKKVSVEFYKALEKSTLEIRICTPCK